MVEKLLVFQHHLNPLHLYCRLLDQGVSRRVSLSVCRSYELLLFIWLTWVTKTMIHLCCLLNRSLSIHDEIRKASS
ncbi:MAG: hypothetical protein JXL84_18750 [Deltaproteobacteria bacterium]|nr:hypothetical protein [Deltaproteobacteria bacterium]